MSLLTSPVKKSKLQELAICSRLFADMLDEFLYQEAFMDKVDADFISQMTERCCTYFHVLSIFLEEVQHETVSSDDSSD